MTTDREAAVQQAHREAHDIREAVHWSGPKCWPEGCPGVDKCCYAEDEGTGPDSADRWVDCLNSLIAAGWLPPVEACQAREDGKAEGRRDGLTDALKALDGHNFNDTAHARVRRLIAQNEAIRTCKVCEGRGAVGDLLCPACHGKRTYIDPDRVARGAQQPDEKERTDGQ